MHSKLNIAIKAAREAGRIISQGSMNLERLRVGLKEKNSFVTDVDHAAEAAIIDILKSAYPKYGILAEESGRTLSGLDPNYQWIIDPLDGTKNYIHGYLSYAISIALVHKGEVEQAVIYDVTRNELFTASKGQGAFLDDRRIRVSHTLINHSTAVIASESITKKQEHLEEYFSLLKRIISSGASFRRMGSAALSLAWVSAGRMDGFWSYGLSPWDIAAGILLIREAGGIVSDKNQDLNFLEKNYLIAGTPKIYDYLLELLSQTKAETVNS